MGMGVVVALLLIVVVGLCLLVLFWKKRPGLPEELATRAAQGDRLNNFDEDGVNKPMIEAAEPRKKKPGLTVELARVATRAAQKTWLSDFDEDCVNKLLLLDFAGVDSNLLAFLDTMELDNLQFLRLSEGYCGTPSSNVIKYRCQLANESESFYRCKLVSSRRDPPRSPPPRASVQDQWLYTVVQPQQHEADMVEIHSNVLPRQAYLKRLKGVIATGCEHKPCTRGFSRVSALREREPNYTSCTNCALVEQLKPGASHVDAALATLLDSVEADAELVKAHSDVGAGNQATVQKIYWRKGVFARKKFLSDPQTRKNPDFDREFEIAKEVSHPNIVHFFGVSDWFSDDQFNAARALYMELLEESLQTRIQEPIQEAYPFSFQDILDILWQVAGAMKELHEMKFIHGDLKPGNILLSRLGMPDSPPGVFYLAKVADFGCAQRVPPEGFADPESADGKSNAAVFKYSIGSLHYSAPEVLTSRNRHRRDQRPPEHPEKIDVFSFGAVAYQMLTGVAQLYEDDKSRSKIIKGIINGTAFVPTTLDSDRRSLFESLVVRCVESNPESRPPFSDICNTLEVFLRNHEE